MPSINVQERKSSVTLKGDGTSKVILSKSNLILIQCNQSLIFSFKLMKIVIRRTKKCKKKYSVLFGRT